jgi:CRISPR-associated protein Cmr2
VRLLLLALGPVQGFIRGARKSQDLWAGSDLMSDLTKAAARALRAGGAALVFPPDPEVDAAERPIANKVLAQLRGTASPGQLAAAAEGAARAELSARFESARARLAGWQIGVDAALAARQLDGFIEMAWACTEVSAAAVGGSDDTSLARAALDHALEGRKQLRDFAGYRGEPRRYKSSIDGALEGVIHEGDGAPVTERLGEALVSDHEVLDALGVVRRFHRDPGSPTGRWRATSCVAVAPYVARARNCPERGPLLRAVRGAAEVAAEAARAAGLGPGAMDDQLGELLLRPPAALRAALAHRLGGRERPLPPALDRALGALAERTAALLRARPGEGSPAPYYAVLSADGDRVGSWLASRSLDGLRQAAHDLARFAAEVIGAHEHREDARVVFAGGDDVLALVSLDAALGMARDLGQRFARVMGTRGITGERDGGAPHSLSVGVAVVHARESFHDAIGLARHLERQAKDAGGGRAAIGLLKRAGQETRVVLGLDELDRLERAIDHLRDQRVPVGLAHELAALAPQLTYVDAAPCVRLVRRMIERKRADTGARPIDPQTLAWIMSQVSSFGADAREPALPTGLADLSALLTIGAHFARYCQVPAPSAATEAAP